MIRRLITAVMLLGLAAGCVGQPSKEQAGAEPAAPYACLLPQEKRMLVAELFFGRNIAGRAPVSETEWSDFTRDVIARNFPDGFTVLDGAGQWRNPQTGAIARESSKILIVAAERSPTLAAKLTDIIEAYRTRFRQLSVGIVTRTACAAF